VLGKGNFGFATSEKTVGYESIDYGLEPFLVEMLIEVEMWSCRVMCFFLFESMSYCLAFGDSTNNIVDRLSKGGHREAINSSMLGYHSLKAR